MRPSALRCAPPKLSSMPEAAPSGVAAEGAGEAPEIFGPPAFTVGQKVRAVSAVRNDGTFPGSPRGAFIVEAGEIGYVTGVGEFLQRYYIYRVDFIASGRFVGMRRHEIEGAEGSVSGRESRSDGEGNDEGHNCAAG